MIFRSTCPRLREVPGDDAGPQKPADQAQHLPIGDALGDQTHQDLLRRLAAHYPDATIAGILNRQGRRSARGLSFTAGRVQSLRHHWKIPCHQPSNAPIKGEPLTVADAAHELGLAPSTLHRWLNEGFIAGEQITPGAPWRIRLTDDIRALFVDDAPDGWLAMLEATLAYGVSRQTIMQRVKRGELHAVHVRTGRGKACVSSLRTHKTAYFDHDNQREEQCGDASKQAVMSPSTTHS